MAPDGAVGALVALCSNSALAYAWCKVCFIAWDATLDAAGEKVLQYSRWPAVLRLLLHALYPSYFVYSSTKRLSGPDGPRDASAVRRWTLILSAASVAVGLLGLRDGGRERNTKRSQPS